MAGSPAGARVAGGSKILVPDRCEGDSHRRSGGVEVVRLPGGISGEKAPLEELQVEVRALRVTRAALSVPGRHGLHLRLFIFLFSCLREGVLGC